MHLPNSVLCEGLALATGAAGLAATGLAVAKARPAATRSSATALGLAAAFVFSVQMLNYPVAQGTSGHFLGAILLMLLAGPWLGFLLLALILSVQCLVFKDGGLTALGANLCNMGVAGGWAAYGLYALAQKRWPSGRLGWALRAGGAAWLSVFLAALACTAELALSGAAWSQVAPAMLGTHALIGLGESAITAGVLVALLAVQPARLRAGSVRLNWESH